MPDPHKVESLIDKIKQVLDQQTKKEPVNPKEFLSVLGAFVAFICDQLAATSSSLEEVDTIQEDIISFFFQQYIHPSFDERRRQLLLTRPEVSLKFSAPREELLNQINEILVRNHITPEDGYFLLGRLAYLITCLGSHDIETQEDLMETQRESLAHIKEGLGLALDVIQVEKGWVTRQ